MNLTETQQRAVTTIDRSLGIIAGAGAGKTRVLVERCAYLLDTGGLEIAQLLAITFTDRAAQELRERLFARLPSHLHPRLHAATITTFHGLAMRILQTHAPLVGLSPNFGLLDEAEARHLLEQTTGSTLLRLLEQRDQATLRLFELYNFAQLVGRLMPLVDDRWNLQQWHQSTSHASRVNAGDCRAALAMTNDGSRATSGERRETSDEESSITNAVMHLFKECATAYQAAKRSRQVADFHDLEIFTLELFETHPEVLSDYQRQYKQILVDEFQDTNPVQMALIDRLFTPPDNVLCIVGDPKQSIYRFRGAQVSCFAEMLQHIAKHGGEVIALRENFRSLPGVVDFVNRVFPETPAEQQMLAIRSSDSSQASSIEWLHIGESEERRSTEASEVAQRIQHLVDSGAHRYGDVAILFPTYLAITPYAEELRAQDIPVHIYGGRGLLQRREILDLLFALEWLERYIEQRPDDALLLTVLRTPLFGLSDDECYRLRHMVSTSDRESSLVARRSSLVKTSAPLHEATLNVIWIAEQLMSWVEQFPLLTIPELLELIAEGSGYLDVLRALDPTGRLATNVEKFIHLAHRLTAHQPLTLHSFLETVRGLQRRGARIGEQPVLPTGENAVQLLTIHAAKGNEFPVVILADLAARRHHRSEAWCFLPEHGLGIRDLTAESKEEGPRWQQLKELDKEAETAEAERLLYVALTRAADRLILPFYQPEVERQQKKSGNHGWTGRLMMSCEEMKIEPVCHREEPRGRRGDPVDVTGLPRRAAPRNDTTNLQHITQNSTLHLTVTQLETFARNPQEYYLRYVLGAPTDDLTWPELEQLPEHVRGDIVHTVIQRHARGPETTLQSLTEAELTCRGFDPALAQEAPLRNLLATYQGMPAAEVTEQFVEYPFRLRMGVEGLNAIITGTIDCLRQHNGGWEILDYKTDRIRSKKALPEHAAAYSLQMGTYALAAWEAGYRPLHQTTLYFLDAGAPHAVRVDETRLEETRKQLEQTILQITELR